MDKEEKKAEELRWDWLPAHMPGVAKIMAEKRKTFGNRHVNLCWHRAVNLKEPGWFFAREGALAIGVPWESPGVADFAALHYFKDEALVLIRDPSQVPASI